MDEVLRHLRAATGGRTRHWRTDAGEWVEHRVLVARGLDADGTLGEVLARLRRCGLVESYGRGSRRHHALTREALSGGAA